MIIKFFDMNKLYSIIEKYVKMIQLVAIAFSIIGTLLIFYNSPFASSQIYAPTIDDTSFYKKDLNKRNYSDIGLTFLIAGIIIQILPICKPNLHNSKINSSSK